MSQEQSRVKASSSHTSEAKITLNCQSISDLPSEQRVLAEALFAAIEEENIEALIKLIDQGISVNVKNRTGCTALHAAVCKGSLRMIELLLSLDSGRASVNIVSFGHYPLGTAAFYNQVDIGVLLFKHGARYEDAERLLIAAERYLPSNNPYSAALTNLRSIRDRYRAIYLNTPTEQLESKQEAKVAAIPTNNLSQSSSTSSSSQMTQLMTATNEFSEVETKKQSNTSAGIKKPHIPLGDQKKNEAEQVDFKAAHDYCQQGKKFQASGKYVDAVDAYEKSLAIFSWYVEPKAEIQKIIGMSYDDYQTKKTNEEKRTREVSKVVGEIGMFRRGKESGAIKKDSQAEDARILNIILGYADWAPGQVISYYNLGKELFSKQRYAEAVAAYDESLAFYPEYLPAQSARSEALSKQANSCYRRGEDCFREQKYTNAAAAYGEAVAAYDKILAISPKDQSIHSAYCGALSQQAFNHLRCAEGLFRAQQHAEAVTAYGKAAALYDKIAAAYGQSSEYYKSVKSNHAIAHIGRGAALRTMRKYAEALGAYGAAIAINPNSSEYPFCLARNGRQDAWGDWRYRGSTHYNEGVRLNNEGSRDYAKILVSYDAAIAIYEEMAAYDKALLPYGYTVELNLTRARAHAFRARALSGLKRYPEALAAYGTAVALYEESAPYDKSTTYYKQEHTGAYDDLGNVLCILKRFPEAIAAYDKSLAISPYGGSSYRRKEALRAWHSHVGELGRLGQLKDALAECDKLSALNDPNHDTLRRGILHSCAYFHSKRGDDFFKVAQYEEAFSAYKEAITKDERYYDNRADIKQALGKCIDSPFKQGQKLHGLKRHNEALKEYNRALSLCDKLSIEDANALQINSKRASIYVESGNAFIALGQRKNAISSYFAALEIDETLPGVKGKLQELTGISYEDYKVKMLKGLRGKLVSVASEVSMFKRDAKTQTAIKMNSQAEEAQLLKIVLDYAGCPPEEESSCCIS